MSKLLTLLTLLGALTLPALAAAAPAAMQLRIEAGEHSAGIRRIAVSPDMATLATVGDDKTGRLWRAADRRLLAVLRVPIGDGDDGRLYGVAFSPDGRQVAIAGTQGEASSPHRIDVFDAANGAHLRRLPLDAGHVVRLLWTRNGRQLAACLSGRDGLRIVDADSGRLAHAEAFAAPCFGLAELPDGSLLVAGFDGEIRQLQPQGQGWRVARRLRTEIADPQSIAVAPDGRHFVVGYRSRLPSGAVAIDVFDTATLTLARRFSFGNLSGASLGAVAWSHDGRTIAASGRAYQDDFRHVLQRIRWPQGEVDSAPVATDTVQDMVALGPDRFALASSTGAWGTVGAVGPVQLLGATVVDVRGADNLRADDTLRTISFGGGLAGQGALRFSLQRRQLESGGTAGLDSARRLSFSLQVTNWQDEYQPVIAGRAVAMGALEVSRAYALLPDSAGLVLGTSRSLRRFDRQGVQQWAVHPAGEVRSLTVSRDGRLVVSAQLDGSVRWWRAADGALLLSLFTSVDGRWVLWTEQGYYDAGIGAESLIGWHVNRADGSGVDFHSIGQFRDRYHRPDVIDRVLDTLDVRSALVQADAARRLHVDAGPPAAEAVAAPGAAASAATAVAAVATAPAAAPAAPVAPLAPAIPAPPLVPNAPIAPTVPIPPLAAAPPPEQLPPVLSVYNERAISSESTRLRLAFSVRAGGLPADGMIVRVNGRPAPVSDLTMPALQDGRAQGHLVVQMPAGRAELSVMAQAGPLVSEPVRLLWAWRPPADGKPATTTQAKSPDAPAGAAGQAAATGRLFFVAIGVSKYARKDYELGLPAKDATDFAALMNRQAGVQYASVQSRLLTDEGATRAAVLAALDWLRQSVGPGDTGMLFIAGHGVNDAGGRYFFLPHDADVDQLARTSVSEAQLRHSLSGIRGKAVMFADTCFAGKVVGTGAALNSEISRLANALAAAENGVIVFSSSTGRQPSLELAKWGNGAFTKALIEGLQGGADYRKDGVVTHQGLSYYLGREVAKLTSGRQTPVTAVPLGVVDYPMVALAAR